MKFLASGQKHSYLIVQHYCLIIYVISTKSEFLFGIRRVFIVFYLVYFGLVCKTYFMYRRASSYLYCHFYFAYTVLKPIILVFFCCVYFSYIVTVTYFEMLPIKTIALFNFSLIVFTINYIQYIIGLNVKDKFRFSDQIINNGNSLILVSNRREKFYFVVKQSILF
jgi:hypothetical protein